MSANSSELALLKLPQEKFKGRILTLTLDVAAEKKRKDVTVQCVKDWSFLDVDPSKENSNAFESCCLLKRLILIDWVVGFSLVQVIDNRSSAQ